jgi:hypothetical protein
VQPGFPDELDPTVDHMKTTPIHLGLGVPQVEVRSVRASGIPADVEAKMAEQQEVISNFRNAHPSLTIDEVFGKLTRLNPEFFED